MNKLSELEKINLKRNKDLMKKLIAIAGVSLLMEYPMKENPSPLMAMEKMTTLEQTSTTPFVS